MHVATVSSLKSATQLEELPTISEKKDFKTEFKKFSKKVVERVESKDPSRVDTVKKSMMAVARMVLENFKAVSYTHLTLPTIYSV